MASARTFLSRVLGLVNGRRAEARLDQELRSHLEMEADELQRQGLPASEARLVALRRFGGVEQTKEVWRAQRGLPGVEG